MKRCVPGGVPDQSPTAGKPRSIDARAFVRKSAPRPAVLAAPFFDRPADAVAHDLIGTALVRRAEDRELRSVIVETEAYLGPHDLACHAARGRTRRTEVMFGPPGTLYVYFIYGMHWMLNVVTGKEGNPAAVLIRGLADVSGPGRLTAAFGIDKALNGSMASPDTGLWFETMPGAAPRILTTPRIGVDYAGPAWAARKLRFVMKA